MATFPKTVSYQIAFRNSDTGLTPTFTLFRDTVTKLDLAKPAISEEAFGMYSFSWTWQSKDDNAIELVVDGGASIPTEEIRYIPGVIAVPTILAISSGGAGGGGSGYQVG